MNSSPHYHPEARADVCLLLEGTFPYVRGGVSTWVKQMIEGMPHLSFSIIYLGAEAASQGEPAYELPDNVVHLETHWLLESAIPEPVDSGVISRVRGWARKSGDKLRSRQRFIDNNVLHSQLRAAASAPRGHTLRSNVAARFTELLVGPDAITEEELQQDKDAWETIREKYNDAPPGLDFNHFFWSVRSMHGPLFTLAKIVSDAPEAALYHSVSTGYAGFLGAMLKNATGKPFIISEHGIYTKERELDLAQVEWIPQELDPFKVGLNDNMSYLRSVWIRFFASLGRMSYGAADQVFTLYDGNRQRQLLDGADDVRLSIIPNGVNVQRFRTVRRSEQAEVPPVLALIGRVVPIKDIKNFIRAMRIIRSRMPEAEGWLFGPEDEDEDYTRECKMLVESLGLSHVVKFQGFGKPDEIFPQVGLSILTSVSEGQPLVVLEGFAAGIPAVTTDVGSCSELIYGVDEEDRKLGVAGAVVPIADPAAFADAAIALLSDREAWLQASRSAIARVECYYDEVDMISRYQTVYENQINGSQGDPVVSKPPKAA
ncbi:GT4 family glycosyltransferase PelF [Granulosicoccus antarcticus]|uniref:Glycosyltransferase EpsD n=1 Tax=Granulosicoccus antarcticus IMCC3135 TaxID=1192854 RepID=A0A2Z2NHP6_9GAMM|nr:GT4 family glycosyltransferase PelF [Granulosicoccus antarcticus]ASJ70563.1 Putative glycosyltransferase EpsD [Granulosicoccus antarcticus IMCC3135]